MTDFADLTDERLNIITELAAGNGSPLADYLEAGGDLHEDQRKVLVKYLRGELERKRGNRETYSSKMRKSDIFFRLCALQRRIAMEHGSYKAYTRALDAHEELYPAVGRETLRQIAKHGLLKKRELEQIDKVRAELISGSQT